MNHCVYGCSTSHAISQSRHFRPQARQVNSKASRHHSHKKSFTHSEERGSQIRTEKTSSSFSLFVSDSLAPQVSRFSLARSSFYCVSPLFCLFSHWLLALFCACRSKCKQGLIAACSSHLNMDTFGNVEGIILALLR